MKMQQLQRSDTTCVWAYQGRKAQVVRKYKATSDVWL